MSEKASADFDNLSLIVRNTFIDAVPEDEAEAEPNPLRTQSDPTGGRSKHVLQLGRIPDRGPLREGTRAQEEGDDEFDMSDFAGPAVPPGLGCDDDDEEEDEDEVPLARTASTAYPGSAFPGFGRTLSAGEAASPASVVLQRLLTGGGEDEAFASMMPQMGYPGYHGYPHMTPWGMYPNPYGMPTWDSMMPFGLEHTIEGGEEMANDGQQDSLPSALRETSELDAMLPPLGEGPPIGNLHSFHQETKDMGIVTHDFRQFTKVGYEGRLSVVSESRVHNDATRYLVQFTAGELSRADGVGFVFSQRLPCAKNIQRIVSIFVNQRGRICMRIFADIIRASAYVKPLELGDWVEMAVDLQKQVVTFNIWSRTENGWPPLTGTPSSTAEFIYGNKLAKINQGGQKPVKLNVGHLACVVKNVGVTVTLFS